MLGMGDAYLKTTEKERRGPLYTCTGPLSTKLCITSSRCWIAGAGDADPVIGEGGVHAGEFDFGHVTGDALFGAHRTGVGVAARGFLIAGFSQVAGEAFGIVVRSISYELFVRIVTGDTADSRVVRVMALAIEHAIRLKANVVDA